MNDNSSINFLKQIPGVDFKPLQAIFDEREILKSNNWSKPWRTEFDQLPDIDSTRLEVNDGLVEIKGLATPEQMARIKAAALALKDWKKGPFKVFDLNIDAEWRSDYKWQRIAPFLPNLKDQVVLDIGCNNGYFMFLMAQQNPQLVLGIDPVPRFWAQFEMIKKYSGLKDIFHTLFGVEHVSYFKHSFDTIFSMGILYHHRNPLQQLIDMREALKYGGTLVLETIGIPGDEAMALTPKERYANMRNVWFLPTLPALIQWLERCKFTEIEVITTEWSGPDEQRKTAWSDSPAYRAALDPQDPSRTIEGYPAPKRFAVIAKTKVP